MNDLRALRCSVRTGKARISSGSPWTPRPSISRNSAAGRCSTITTGSRGVRSILGVVDDASVDGKQGTATVRFSERHDAIAKDVQAGIISKVSAGYTVQRWDVTKRADGMRIKTAVAWQPKEIHLPRSAPTPAHTQGAQTQLWNFQSKSET